MVKKTEEGHTRRAFCVQAASLAVFTGGLAPLLQSCSSPSSPDNVTSLPVVIGTRSSAGITLIVDANSPLAAVGSAALLQTSSGNFLVAHTAQSTFSALSSICTHEVCTINGWSSQSFVCPCHGSTFDTSGHVARGPAPSSLRQYPAQFVDGVLTITA